MPHAPMPWVKLHTTRLDDVRFNRLPDQLKWRWTQLTMLAGKLDAGGAFVLNGEQLTDDEISWHLRIELEAWQLDSDLLKERGYLIRNGHGWQLTDFMDAQGPDGMHAEKREQWRIRQERHRSNKDSVTSDTPVSHASKSQSQSQSQSQESEKSQSQSVLSRELLTLCAVPEKYIQRLTDPAAPSTVTVTDFLAELARNYARIGAGRGQVKNPPAISAMNILKNELPTPTWYSPDNMKAFLPKGVLQYACPDLIQEDQKLSDPIVDSGYANSWIPEKPVVPAAILEAWKMMLALLDAQAGEGKSPQRANYDNWIKDTAPLHFDNGKLIVAARNTYSVDWLNEHKFQDLAQGLLGEFYKEPLEISLTVAQEAA